MVYTWNMGLRVITMETTEIMMKTKEHILEIIYIQIMEMEMEVHTEELISIKVVIKVIEITYIRKMEIKIYIAEITGLMI